MKYANSYARHVQWSRGVDRLGFSLVEVMVTIATMALLLALLMGSIQQSRETARRTQCQNYQHQLGLAMTNYESDRGHFAGGGGLEIWSEFLIPYLDPSYAPWAPWVTGITTPPQNLVLPFLACPSDPSAKGTNIMGHSSYLICNGGTAKILAEDGFARSSGANVVRAADITDGLSHTIAFSERLVWPDYGGQPVDLTDLPAQWPRVMLTVPGVFARQDDFVTACQSSAVPIVPQTWNPTHEFMAVVPPNGNSCMGSYFTYTANSLHPGGVNVLFADGHVQFVSNHIDRGTWRALGTRAGGETQQLTQF